MNSSSDYESYMKNSCKDLQVVPKRKQRQLYAQLTSRDVPCWYSAPHSRKIWQLCIINTKRRISPVIESTSKMAQWVRFLLSSLRAGIQPLRLSWWRREQTLTSCPLTSTGFMSWTLHVSHPQIHKCNNFFLKLTEMYKQGGGEFRIRANRFYTPSSVTSNENKSSVDTEYLNKNTQIQHQMTCRVPSTQ